MGDRATIQFTKQYFFTDGTARKQESVVLYLHWHGQLPMVMAFIEAYTRLFTRSDLSYLTARFVQMVGNWVGGELSVGLLPTDSVWGDHDNGHMVFEVTEEESPDRPVGFQLVSHRCLDHTVTPPKLRNLTAQEIAANLKAASLVRLKGHLDTGITLADEVVRHNEPIANRIDTTLGQMRAQQKLEARHRLDAA